MSPAGPQNMHIRGNGDGIAGHEVGHGQGEHVLIFAHLHIQVHIAHAFFHQTVEGGKEAVKHVLLGDEADELPFLVSHRQSMNAIKAH